MQQDCCLQADICQLGMDQRKVNMLAREYCDKIKRKLKPVILSHEMLPGLLEVRPPHITTHLHPLLEQRPAILYNLPACLNQDTSWTAYITGISYRGISCP